MDLTWVSDQRGWALAAVPCVRGLCPRVAATGDGGRTWTALPVPPGIIEDESGAVSCAPVACVGQIRFAAAKVGYLFGPALFQTDEGGRTWRRVPTARWRPSNRWRARWSGWCMTTLAALARAPGRCRKPPPGRTGGARCCAFPRPAPMVVSLRRWSGRAHRSSIFRSMATSPGGPDRPREWTPPAARLPQGTFHFLTEHSRSPGPLDCAATMHVVAVLRHVQRQYLRNVVRAGRADFRTTAGWRDGPMRWARGNDREGLHAIARAGHARQRCRDWAK